MQCTCMSQISIECAEGASVANLRWSLNLKCVLIDLLIDTMDEPDLDLYLECQLLVTGLTLTALYTQLLVVMSLPRRNLR